MANAENASESEMASLLDLAPINAQMRIKNALESLYRRPNPRWIACLLRAT